MTHHRRQTDGRSNSQTVTGPTTQTVIHAGMTAVHTNSGLMIINTSTKCTLWSQAHGT